MLGGAGWDGGGNAPANYGEIRLRRAIDWLSARVEIMAKTGSTDGPRLFRLVWQATACQGDRAPILVTGPAAGSSMVRKPDRRP